MSSAIPRPVKSLVFPAVAMAYCALALPAATLEKLSLDEMIIKSTAIVRGKVVDSYTTVNGPIFHTHYRLQVSETFKGPARGAVEIEYPGGVINNQRQNFAGVPQFQAGDEYVFFLWGGQNGMVQVVGLSQGLFAIPRGDSPDPMTMRAASHEVVLDRVTGKPTQAPALTMPLSQLRARIKYIMGGAQN